MLAINKSNIFSLPVSYKKLKIKIKKTCNFACYTVFVRKLFSHLREEYRLRVFLEQSVEDI
jgi:hypothetical protein